MDHVFWPIKNKTILITGGGGYLGSKFLQRTLHHSSVYYILDQGFNSLTTELAEKHQNIILIKADISFLYELERNLTKVKPDLIFHFAAILDRTRDFGIFERLHKINVIGTLNLLEVFQNVPYQCFYYVSSSEVYGAKNPVPFHEEQAPHPLSPYSLTKLMAEEVIKTFSDIHKKKFMIARVFNFFGPDMPDSTFIPQLLTALKNDVVFKMTAGEQKRDYLFIDDLVYFLAAISCNPDGMNQIINVCSGKSLTMKDIAESVQLLSKGKLQISATLPYRDNELWDNTGSNKKLVKLVPPRELLSLQDWLKELPEFSS